MSDLLKLTCFFGERDRVAGRFWSDVLMEAVDGAATGILFRATAGFGRHHHLRDDRTLTLSEDPSVMAVVVDTVERMTPLVERVAALQPRGLVTVERARSLPSVEADEVAPANSGVEEVAPAHSAVEEVAPAHSAVEEVAQRPSRDLATPDEARLTVLVGRRDRHGGEPAHVAICRLLQEYGVAGASALVGVDGIRDGTRQRAGFWARNADVPTMVLGSGTDERVRAVLPALRELLDDPVLIVERVRVCKRDGALLARPHALPDADGSGRPLWQKLAVYTSESHLHAGRPVHRELVRRLRDEGARGATALRGLWGFHGDHAPHGDRLLQLGRHVPVVTVAIDAPSRIAALFDVVDELTAEHGLVTTEMVPALLDPPHPFTPGTDLASYDF